MKVQYIAIHHTAVSYNKNADQFDANNIYHKDKWNFKSSLGYYLGYHYEISKAGKLRQARKETEDGAHVVGYNHLALGIALDGNFDSELPTKEQETTLKKLLLELKGRYPNAIIKYHRDFPDAKKTCPGKLIPDNWANNLLNDMKKIIGDNRDKKQYIQGDDGKLHWLFSLAILNELHEAGIIDKNRIEWRDNLDEFAIGNVWGVIL